MIVSAQANPRLRFRIFPDFLRQIFRPSAGLSRYMIAIRTRIATATDTPCVRFREVSCKISGLMVVQKPAGDYMLLARGHSGLYIFFHTIKVATPEVKLGK